MNRGHPKLMPKLILEGTRLTHKTEIAFALNEHPGFVGPRKYRYHSPLISAEWCGFTPTPWGRGLINFEVAEEARAMETYRAWITLFELMPYYSWIVDRFHLSTVVYQSLNAGRTYDFTWLEERLVSLGFHLALCTRAEDTFESARLERLAVSGNPAQYDDLGNFHREQEKFREIYASSILPRQEFDLSDGDVYRATSEIVEWMRISGGLWSGPPTLP